MFQHLVLLDDNSLSELNEFHVQALSLPLLLDQEYILWLDIAVNDVNGMQVAKSLDDLLDDLSRISLFEEWLRDDVVKQFSALQLLLHDVDPFVVLECFKDLDNVGMVDLREYLDFIHDFGLLALAD